MVEHEDLFDQAVWPSLSAAVRRRPFGRVVLQVDRGRVVAVRPYGAVDEHDKTIEAERRTYEAALERERTRTHIAERRAALAEDSARRAWCVAFPDRRPADERTT